MNARFSKYRYFVFFAILSAVVFFQTSIVFAETPKSCVERADRAIENSDTELFLANVDIDALIQSGLTVFLEELKKPEVVQQMSPMLALLFSQVADPNKGAALRVLLAKETKSFILYGIASGAFAGKRVNSTAKEGGVLAPLFANASMGRKKLVDIEDGSALENGWSVSFVVLDDGNDSEYPIEAFVDTSDGTYKVRKILNLPQLFEQIREEEHQFNSLFVPTGKVYEYAGFGRRK